MLHSMSPKPPRRTATNAKKTGGEDQLSLARRFPGRRALFARFGPAIACLGRPIGVSHEGLMT